MNPRKIVITGGPGTGKTSVIEALERLGHLCLHEISRAVTKEAQEKGIDQLFLKDPLLFSELLLEGRIKQYEAAHNFSGTKVFLDRGIPDVVSYMNYFGNDYPPVFNEVCNSYRYDEVVILPPWKEIYTSDNERYETYEQATAIHDALLQTYSNIGYKPIEVPCGSVTERVNFILNSIGSS